MARKIRKRLINFDEAVSDSISREFGLKELPLSGRVFKIVLCITTLLVAVVLLRITFLGVLNQSYYLEIALDNMNQEIMSVAPRGLITDRYGKELVSNEPAFNVRLEVPTMIKSKEREKVLRATHEILGLTNDEVLDIISSANLERFPDVVLKRDIELKQAIDIKSLGLESLYAEDSYKRNYPSVSLAHAVGFVGFSEDDNTLKGRAGLEAYYDELLRGKDGKKIIYKDALGNIEGTEILSEFEQGGELKTTLDYEFQEYFYNRLLQGLQSLGRTSGIGIALNPKNGEVLALVSLPSFNPNKVADSLSGSNRPFFNRAVSGAYSPGSAIKPIHAAAILEENVVSPDYQIFSQGYIEIPNPYFPDKPSRFLDWKPHGWVNVYSALARSSNVYFYETVGGFENLKGLGIKRLTSYWEKFGFGKLTGIDLPGEALGFLPNPEEKEERTGSPWRVGDTYNVAIGQGDILINPLQLLDAIVAIAEGGRVYAPHFKAGDSALVLDISDLETEFKEIKKGMEDAVSKPYGTAYSLSNLPLKVAAKTGSAQTANNTKTNALFVGYGPANPSAGGQQVAILVLIEDAKEGSLNAIPVAEDVFRWYYEKRLK